MESFINWIAGFLVSILDWILSLVKTIFLVLWDMLIDLVCKIISEVLSVAVSILQSIPISAQALNFSSYLSGAPAEFLGMLVAVRIPEAIGIIVIALGIRFVLQLIPFVRLGS